MLFSCSSVLDKYADKDEDDHEPISTDEDEDPSSFDEDDDN